jgi:alcohol dehydrogenase class IV
MFDAPHGAACAALLPHAMRVNIRALRARASESEALRRYETVARVLTGDAAVSPEDGVASVEQLCRDLAVSSLRTYGICERDVPELVQKAAKASSMKGNPITLSGDELTELLVRAL